MQKILLLFITCLTFLHSLYAQIAGDLDPTFGKSGISTTQFASGNFGNEFGQKIFLQSDGRMIVVALIENGFALCRYNPDGTLDKSYGKNGTSDPSYLPVLSAAIQPDGKVLVTGNKVRLAGSMAYVYSLIVRYNTNGTLDASFGFGGIQELTDIESTFITVAPNGDILVGVVEKEEYFDEEHDFKVLRWGNGGDQQLVADFGGVSEAATSIAVQEDGKIVVSGTTFNGSAYDIAVARFNTDGSLDATFSGDGKARLGYSSLASEYYPINYSSVVIQPDGKIVVAGSTSDGGAFDLALARFNSTGTLDNTFDKDGKLNINYDANEEPGLLLAMQPGGKILFGVGGLHIYRYTSTGSPDLTFDGDGRMMPDFGAALSFGLYADGKMVLTGGFNNGFNSDIILARYNSSGALDQTFDGDGKSVPFYSTGNSSFISTAIQKDGKIVAMGRFFNGSTDNKVLTRYGSNGSLDLSFSGDGKVPLDDNAYRVAMQPDGKIIVVTTVDRKAILIRYNSDGSQDQTFAVGGKLTHEYPSVNAMCTQPDGKLVVVSNGPLNGNISVIRYLSNGSLDPGFGTQGKTVFNFGGGINIQSVALQANGKILVSGSAEDEIALIRFTSIGILDESFNEGGVATSRLNSWWDTDFGALSLAIDSKDRIVVAAEAYIYDRLGSSELYLGRFTSEGFPDVSFAGEGAIAVGFFRMEDPNPYPSLAVQTDDKIVLSTVNALYRFDQNGNLDPTFVGGGVFGTTYGGQVIMTNKRIFVVGSGLAFPQTLASIASYLLEANKAPVIKITAPANSAYYKAPATINMSASASDPDGSISKVEFYNGTKLLVTERYAPYTYSWQNVPAGTYKITAKAYDNMGKTATSAAVQVVVGASALPLVSITTPVNNASFTAPATINISASASDPDGTVSKVEFYNGTALLGTDLSSSYTYSWQNVAAGTYRITAKAFDNSGMAATSAPITITVSIPNKPPVVKITAPYSNAVYSAPANVSIAANAADPDGSISKVEFYNGTALLAIERYAPYTYQWQNVAAGTYKLTAKAYDNKGKVTTSAAVQISVQAGNGLVAGSSVSEKEIANKDGVGSSPYLEQNSPNPVRGSTSIGYFLPEGSKKAALDLIDQTGSIIKVYVLQQAKGKGRIELNTTGLPAGAYLYSLSVDGKVVATKPMMVIR